LEPLEDVFCYAKSFVALFENHNVTSVHVMVFFWILGIKRSRVH